MSKRYFRTRSFTTYYGPSTGLQAPSTPTHMRRDRKMGPTRAANDRFSNYIGRSPRGRTAFPPHLAPGKNIEGKEMRQVNVLRQRFLHTRMLLYRPILSGLMSSADTDISSITSPVRNTLLQRMAIRCLMLCVQAAYAAI
jgi:hypothetical protein